MNWPDVRPVLLMVVNAPPVASVAGRGADPVSRGLPQLPFDPPSHDGTDPWKWER